MTPKEKQICYTGFLVMSLKEAQIASLERVREIILEAIKGNVTDLDVNDPQRGFRLRLKFAKGQVTPSPVTISTKPEEHVTVATTETGTGNYQIQAPCTGLFHRKPNPQSTPFVMEGNFVETGQTVGLLESNKVFLEVKAEKSGRVTTIIETGNIVTKGTVLVVIDTTIPPPQTPRDG